MAGADTTLASGGGVADTCHRLQVVAFLREREAHCAAQAALQPQGAASTLGLLWGILRIMAQHGGYLHTMAGAKPAADGMTAGGTLLARLAACSATPDSQGCMHSSA